MSLTKTIQHWGSIMHLGDKTDKIVDIAMARDQYLIVTKPDYRTVNFTRFVEGEPGEDPAVDEDQSKIIPPEALRDEIHEVMAEADVPMDAIRITIYTDVREPGDNSAAKWRAKGAQELTYPIIAWRIVCELIAQPVMAPPKILKKCQTLAGRKGPGGWMDGLKESRPGSIRKSESRTYTVGQEVRPASVRPPDYGVEPQFRWYFVTSYRTGGGAYGAFRMLRVSKKGVTKLTSASTIIALEKE